MPILTYLLKVAICSGLLTGYYYLALRNRAFHHWNRFYLLATVVLSLTVPLLTFTVFHSGADKDTAVPFIGSGNEYVVFVTRNNTPSLSLEQGLGIVYTVISIVLLSSLVISLLKVISLIKRNAVQQVNNIHFINSHIQGTPFSFFRYIFWNPSIDLQSENGKRIFRHELAHVRERHSLDKLLLQLVLVFFWCNPFFWLIRHELRMIHEFIADRKALDQQDASALAAMILQSAYPTRYNQLINSFFHQSIKRRIHMLTNNQSPRISYISRLMFIPLAATLVLAFSVRTKPVPAGHPASPVTSSRNLEQSDTIPVASDKIRSVNVTAEGIEVVYKDGTTARLTIAEAEAMGLNVRATRKDSSGTSDGSKNSNLSVRGDFKGLVVVDGKEFKGDIEKIDPNTIQSVNVLKGVAATDKYGNKAKEGVIEITLKSPIKGFNGLVIVDGKQYKEGLDQIDPNNIQSMNVLKDAAATEKYGSRGKDGVIEIILKKTTTSANSGDPNKPTASNSPTFTQTEIPPQFPGGVPAWRDFLQKNLKAVVPLDKGAPEGAFTVITQLLIEKDGTISEIKPLTTHGFGMEEEVVRTMKLSPKWVPAKQNGHVVRAYHKQPITFVIASGGETKEETPAAPKNTTTHSSGQ